MDTPFSGYFVDASKCRPLSLDKKIQIVRELSKFKEHAQDKLQSWSRKDILDILCQDIVKERKFTGLSKQRILDYLFKVTSGTNPNKNLLEEPEKDEKQQQQQQQQQQHEQQQPDRPVAQLSPAKRQRKSDAPTRVVITNLTDETEEDVKVCVNVACRNRYNGSDPFCKRCSCCICYKFDENKDPSLWLFCTSDPPYQGYSCGRSCHIECALRHDKTAIGTGTGTKLDGSYFCPFCGKENDLLGCWKKQLNVAKDARRVDVLCYRIYLINKLVNSSEKYNQLYQIVESAKKKLETDVGRIIGSPNMGRGIVNRLQFGSEVQKLCAKGVEMVEKLLGVFSDSSPVVETKILHSNSNSNSVPSSFIRFPIVASTCLTMVLKLEEITSLPPDLAGFHLWHRRSNTSDYPIVPTGTILLPNRNIVITELVPSTQYKFKLIAFNHVKTQLNSWEVNETTTCSSKEDSKGLEIKKQPSFDFSNPNSSSKGVECKKQPSFDFSNPNSSEGGESNNSAAVYADLNKSPERETDSDFEDFNKNGRALNGSGSDPVVKSKESPGTEETNGISRSALDEELVPNSIVPVLQDPRSENESNTPNVNENNGAIIRLVSTRPVTPVRFENNGLVPGSSSKKRVSGLSNDDNEGSNYEYCVKVVRKLECEGLIESSFRVKFLTWFSLRASAQEKKIVSVYVDTLVDDLVSLAGQLSDTFSERIYSKRPPPVPNGFCMQLWH